MRRVAPALLLAASAACAPRESRHPDTIVTDSASADGSAWDTSQAPAPPPAPAPTRRDGERTDPPIHRTNPRDEDVMNPGGASPEALLAEITRLAKGGPCAREGDCRTLPVGRKACGGPRSYIVFCATATDVGALRRKLSELDAADRAAVAAGAVSDCSLALEPVPVLSGGVCRAGTASP